MSIPVSWMSNTSAKVRRSYVDPSARQGHADVSLAWLQKHCEGLAYRVRWWEGPDGHTGKWEQRDFDFATTLRDIKSFAFVIAGTATLWEVEVTLLGRFHTNEGWDRGTVWTFGHYQRETDEAKTTRGRA
jgi:hypothetical protein